MTDQTSRPPAANATADAGADVELLPLSLQLGTISTSPRRLDALLKPKHTTVTKKKNHPTTGRRPRRPRANPVPEGKSETIPPPYPWATDRRARIHTMNYLINEGITTISGEVQCKKCEEKYEISYDLVSKFHEVTRFIDDNKHVMNDRAPVEWNDPTLPGCKVCGGSDCAKPVMGKKREINWLFLLLGQLIGCCKLWDLKYFCKHTRNHRTGAKDRVLYLTYLNVCKQLVPSFSF